MYQLGLNDIHKSNIFFVLNHQYLKQRKFNDSNGTIDFMSNVFLVHFILIFKM